MKYLGIIPARYASTRFPAKPLALLGGKTVIQRVYEQVVGVLDDVYVATDDERIEAAVKAFGGKVVMTSVDHKSGTDRCYEAARKIGGDFDVVVNIQGDEPFIQPSQLEAVKACFNDASTQIATLVKPFNTDDRFALLENVNSPKVVVNKNWNALYFSRSIIPYQRGTEKEKWLRHHTYYKHIGLYAYRMEVLKEITSLEPSVLEQVESLEQLRWLENGYTIKVGLSETETIGIDTPEDLEAAERFLEKIMEAETRAQQPRIKELENFSFAIPQRTILANGVPLSVINAGEQEVVRLDILFGGGRWQQSQLLQSLFTNRMLREGSKRYTASDIAEKLDNYGSWLELSNSAEYEYITLYSLNKYFAETLEILESILKEPLFPEKELHTVIETNIQQYLVNTSKVDYLAQRGLLSGLYGDTHPTGQLVTEDDYRRITPEVLRDFYRRFYHSGNCAIFVAGKVTDEIIQRVESTFGIAPFGDSQQLLLKKEFPLVTVPQKRIFIEREEGMQSAVKLGCITLPQQHPDSLKLRVLMTLFGGYFGSRLMSNIREDKGYTYGVSSGTIYYPGSGMIIVSAEAANEYVEPLIKEVYHEIDRLHTEPVPLEELAMVKNYMLGDMCRSYESAFSLSDAWMFIYTSGLGDDYFARSVEAIRSTTAEDIKELAKCYLCKESLKEVVAGKKTQ